MKEIEKELVLLDRRKNEFLAILGHELRNPLAAISSGVSLLFRGSSEDQLPLIRDSLFEQIELVTSLINDLLDLTRISQGKIEIRPEQLSAASLCEKAVAAARPGAEANGQKLSVETEPTGHFEGDPRRMMQVLENLISNAMKYSPRGSHIHVCQSVGEDTVTIAISDNGIGLSKDDISKIFEPFIQVRAHNSPRQGLGIGLSLVRQLVALHHGTISATSEGHDKGSTFTITFPRLLSLQEIEKDNGTSPDSAKLVGSPRILIVDDNVTLAKNMAMELEALGGRTTCCFTGLDAVATAERYAPNVILLDIGLPGISGYEIAKELRSKAAFDHTVIIGMTGFGRDPSDSSDLRDLFDDFFTKPVSISKILHSIVEVGEVNRSGNIAQS